MKNNSVMNAVKVGLFEHPVGLDRGVKSVISLVKVWEKFVEEWEI